MATLTATGLQFSLTDVINSKYWMYPAGVKKLFFQAAAPTGWTKDTTENNKMLRVVSGTGGVSGGTIAFDGTNQYTSFSTYTQPAQTSATSFTWNVWIFSNTTTSSPILGNRFGGASWTKYTGFGFEYNSVQNVLTGGTTNGVWRNMSIHKNNTSFSLYRDGSLISTGTNTGSTSSLPFYIGGDPGGEFFNGFVSIVQIYNRSLSSTEVLQNYNAQRSRFNI
jgi:hypothetical protein